MNKNASQKPSAANFGQWAEQEALRIVQQRGYQCIAHNFHSRYGEIDLIVLHNEYVIFIEVKARGLKAWAAANAVVSTQKQIKIAKTALYYLQQFPQYTHFYSRFDVMTFDLLEVGSWQKLQKQSFAYQHEWIENAFTFDEELINL